MADYQSNSNIAPSDSGFTVEMIILLAITITVIIFVIGWGPSASSPDLDNPPATNVITTTPPSTTTNQTSGSLE